MKKAALILVAAASLPAAAQTMKPGEWEITATMTIPGESKPQVMTLKQCVTADQAAKPESIGMGAPATDCKVTPGARSPGSYAWTMACPSQKMTGTGSMKFDGNSMETDIRMTLEDKGGKVQMQTRMNGRYLGACKAK